MSDEKAVANYEANAPARTSGTLAALLQRPDVQKSMAVVATKHLPPERIVKMVLVAVSRQPKLLECTQGSILRSAMTSAQLGLDCSGVLGRAYLVPFRNKNGTMEATFIPGYMGLVDLARNSGDVQYVTAHVVYKQDFFEVEYGLNEKLVHRPNLEADKSDADIVGAYAFGRLKDGTTSSPVFMPKKDIDKIRSKSRAGNSGPWVDFYPDMCLKTVIRKACKYLPLATETVAAIGEAERDEFYGAYSRPEPRVATISLDDLQPGDVEEHTEPDAPLIPAEEPLPMMAAKSFSDLPPDTPQEGTSNDIYLSFLDRLKKLWPKARKDQVAALESRMWNETGVNGWDAARADQNAAGIVRGWLAADMGQAVAELAVAK